MAVDPIQRLVPSFTVYLDGARLAQDVEKAIASVDVQDGIDVISMAAILLDDPQGSLANGQKFKAGAGINISSGFASHRETTFEGEVVTVEPRFEKDRPPALLVRCYSRIHRMGRGTKTRTFKDMKDSQLASKIAQDYGMSADADAAPFILLSL